MRGWSRSSALSLFSSARFLFFLFLFFSLLTVVGGVDHGRVEDAVDVEHARGLFFHFCFFFRSRRCCERERRTTRSRERERERERERKKFERQRTSERTIEGNKALLALSPFFARVNEKLRTPVNSIMMVFIFDACLLLLQLGDNSAVAFNNIVSTCRLVGLLLIFLSASSSCGGGVDTRVV